MRTSSFVTVVTILRPPYQLIYALPLLFISILLLLAGTFLTLDRTRSFASSSDVKKKPLYRLESGIGGLAIGWTLGVHVSTLVALLILNQTETASLSPPAFLVIWLFSAIGLSVVSGRWKYVALVFGGLLGGISVGLILAIALHPSLLTRLILGLIVTITLTVGVLLPFPVVRHTSLRISTSAAGAAGIINTCAILGSSMGNNTLESWASAWLHLVLLHDSDSAELKWDSGKARGLTAAAFFLWMVGAACDWWLKQRIGENPDEAWDNVLGSYAASFPPESSRAGTFAPLKSHWSILKQKLNMNKAEINTEKPLLFPTDAELAQSPRPRRRQGRRAPPAFHPHAPGTLSPDPYDSDSDSDTVKEEKIFRRAAGERKWTASTNYSDATLVNPRPERLRPHRGFTVTFEQQGMLSASPASSYIDYGEKDAERYPELNMGRHRMESSKEDDKNWKPAFLKRSESLKSSDVVVASGWKEDDSRDVTSMLSASYQSRDRSGQPTPLQDYSGAVTPVYAYNSASPKTPGLVHATPSLLRALDRVSRAQREAYAGGVTPGLAPDSALQEPVARRLDDIPNDGLPHSSGRADEQWRGFWADVHRKASEP